MKFEFGAVVGLAIVAVVLVVLAVRREQAESVSFENEVKPLLAGKCLPCHNSAALSGNLNLETRRTAFGGSERGSFIVPGDPDNSLVYTSTDASHGAEAATETMPAVKGVTLDEEERDLLRRWIASGAEWPEGAQGHLKPLDPRPNEA